MVTTRLPRVASIASKTSPYNLGVLPDEDCWSLLKSCALGDNGEEQPPNLVRIGMEIAKKCKGIPLAAKSLGSLLNLKNNESYWTHVRDHPIWKLDNDEGKIILAVLRLSYNHLPSHLKQCFSYSSIDPKDSEMDKTKLIYLWMANGFIQPQGRLELEEVGDDIFHELLRRSFFQDTEEDGYGNIQSFKMHDLMHDLTCSVAENECLITEVGGVKDVPKTIRHLSVIRDSEQSLTVIDPVIVSELSFCTLFFRTLVFFCTLFFEPINFHSFKFSTTLRVLNLCDMRLATLPPSICELKYLRYLDLSCNDLASLPESLCRLRNLQMLDLSNNKITALPHSIGTLEKLRYLSLSYCYCLTSIPESIGNVVSLRYLSLSHCPGLTSIPESIGNVVSLRHLDLSFCIGIRVLPESICNLRNLQYLMLFDCLNLEMLVESMKGHVDTNWRLGLKKMPLGLGELVDLQRLDLFVVDGGDSGCSGIKELHGLNQLRGGLEIVGLENVRNAKEAKEANLIGKVFLQSLTLSWGNVVVHEEIESKEVLECLLQHLPPNLQGLKIDGYPGAGQTCFPQGLKNSCLTELKILGCPNLKSVPEGLTITLLKLEIEWCKSLKSVSEGLQYLTSLQTLEIIGCEEVEFEANDFQHLISLRELRLEYLTRLIALPVMGIQGSNNTLLKLKIEWCNSLKSVSEGLMYLTSLDTLSIGDCEELEFEANDFQHLISLRQLTLISLPKLRALPEGTPMLQELYIQDCENLRRLPQGIQHITTLRSLTIKDCHEDLHTSCEKNKGQDWNLIAHIPNIHNQP